MSIYVSFQETSPHLAIRLHIWDIVSFASCFPARSWQAAH